MAKDPWGPPPFSWPGVIGVILAFSLGLGWAITLVLAALPMTPEPNHDSLELLNGIGQVLAGAVATFMGSAIAGQKRDTRQEDPSGPTTARNPQSAPQPLPGSRSAARQDPVTPPPAPDDTPQ
jgi:hypothetical protein